MTATERLRALLDERGVEWSSPSGLNSSFSDSITFIGDVAVVSEIEGSELLRINFDGTPEQAIAATLDSCNCSNNCTNGERTETCHDSNSRFNAWQCSECGATMLLMFDDYGEPTFSVDGVADVPHFCPNCGARCVG